MYMLVDGGRKWTDGVAGDGGEGKGGRGVWCLLLALLLMPGEKEEKMKLAEARPLSLFLLVLGCCAACASGVERGGSVRGVSGCAETGRRQATRQAAEK